MPPIQHFLLHAKTVVSFDTSSFPAVEINRTFEHFVRPLANRGWCLGEPDDSPYTVSGTLTPNYAKLTVFDEGVPIAGIGICLSEERGPDLIGSMLAPHQEPPANMVTPWVATQLKVAPIATPPWLYSWVQCMTATMLAAY